MSDETTIEQLTKERDELRAALVGVAMFIDTVLSVGIVGIVDPDTYEKLFKDKP
jgi:hypothetical protein